MTSKETYADEITLEIRIDPYYYYTYINYYVLMEKNGCSPENCIIQYVFYYVKIVCPSATLQSHYN